MATAIEPRQRAAALILAIGSNRAGSILQHLSREEVEMLADEMARLASVKRPERLAMVKDSLRHLLSHDPETEAEVIRARARLLPAGSGQVDVGPFAFLEQADLADTVQLLRSEHPQTIAVVLAHQTPERAAKILEQMDDDLALEVSHRIATLSPTPPEVLRRVRDGLAERMEEPAEDAPTDVDGAKELASILNSIDRDFEEAILERLAALDPELAERVRSLMFVFEDIATLDDRTIQKILQSVQTQTLALALKGASETVKDAILRNLSERAREALVEEMDLMGAVRKQEVMEARNLVVAEIRGLEAAGQIVISRGEEGEMIE